MTSQGPLVTNRCRQFGFQSTNYGLTDPGCNFLTVLSTTIVNGPNDDDPDRKQNEQKQLHTQYLLMDSKLVLRDHNFIGAD